MTDRPPINPRTGKPWLRKADNFRPHRRKTDRPYYAGRFPPDLVKAVIEAAAPLPAGQCTITVDQKRVRCSRATAIIRRLEQIDFFNRSLGNDLPASALAKRLHAIAAAGTELLKLLPDNPDNCEGLPAQVQNALWTMADGDGEPAPDSRLCDIIEAIKQLRRWSQKAEQLADARIKRDVDDEGQAAHILSWVKHRNQLAGMEVNIGSVTENSMVGILSIWENILNRPINSGKVHNRGHENQGVAYGKILDFSLACLRLLGLDQGYDTDAIRARIRRLIPPERTQ